MIAKIVHTGRMERNIQCAIWVHLDLLKYANKSKQNRNKIFCKNDIF